MPRTLEHVLVLRQGVGTAVVVVGAVVATVVVGSVDGATVGSAHASGTRSQGSERPSRVVDPCTMANAKAPKAMTMMRAAFHMRGHSAVQTPL